MTQTLVTVDLTHMVCGTCGVHFAMDEHRRKECQEDGGTWYCPNGHARVYRTPEVVKLRESLQQAQREAIRAREAARVNDEERAKAERKVARLLKRSKNGVCPFGCKRTFKQLAAHVKSKHPAAEGEILLAEAKGK